MKKRLLILFVISVLMLSIIPGVFAYGSGGSLGGSFTVEDFDPIVWQCGNRILTDEDVQPWRFSGEYINSFPEEREVILSAADRIVDLQYTDGSWDWVVTDAVGPTGTTYLNIAGVTAEVLLDAYELTQESDYLNAAKKTGDYLIAQIGDPQETKRHNSFNIVFLYNLYDASGVIEYKNEADAILNHVLHEQNYWTTHNGNNCGVDGCTAHELLEALKNYRGATVTPNGIVVWDLYKFVEAANRAGESAFALDMANELKNYMDQAGFNSAIDYYEIGLSGGILALANAGLDYSSYLAKLLAVQIADGSFSDEPVQGTAYALMALKEAGETDAADDAAGYLMDNFGYSGLDGWLESDLEEYSEATSEAAQALFEYIGVDYFLYERAGNYMFEGEKYKIDVVVFDKNKIDSVHVDLIMDSNPLGIGSGGTETIVTEKKVTYCGDIPSTSTDWEESITLPKFNPALGDLTEVELEFGAGLSSDIQIEHLGTSTPAEFIATVDGNVTLNFSDVYLQTNIVFDRSGNATTYDGLTDFAGTSGVTFPTISAYEVLTKNSSNIGDFIAGAPGENFNVSVEAESVFQVNGPGNYATSVLTNANASACVTYTYEEESVIILPSETEYSINCVEIEDIDFDQCNARIDEEEITEYNESTMQAYECTITILDSEHMYGEYWLGVLADDGVASGIYDELTPLWLNPIITLAVDGNLMFEELTPGTSIYYSQATILNSAEGGVALDMFITGKDWPSVAPGNLGRCMNVDDLGVETGELVNYLPLGAFRYYAKNGAFDTSLDAEVDDEDYYNGVTRDVDDEGYVNIHKQINAGFEERMFDETEIIQAGGPVVNGVGYRANVLNQGGLLALTFKLNLPEPCYGEFESPSAGSVFIWGEAI